MEGPAEEEEGGSSGSTRVGGLCRRERKGGGGRGVGGEREREELRQAGCASTATWFADTRKRKWSVW